MSGIFDDRVCRDYYWTFGRAFGKEQPSETQEGGAGDSFAVASQINGAPHPVARPGENAMGLGKRDRGLRRAIGKTPAVEITANKQWVLAKTLHSY